MPLEIFCYHPVVTDLLDIGYTSPGTSAYSDHNSSLLKFPSEAEHGLNTNPEQDDSNAAHDELCPGVQGPGSEQEDHAGVPTVTTCLGWLFFIITISMGLLVSP